MQRQIDDMLAKGIISENSSAWSGPVILISKKFSDGKPKYRFCVDFRALNAISQYECYPLPIFDDTLANLHGCKYFSALDGWGGYH
jgi:hypothetical protein